MIYTVYPNSLEIETVVLNFGVDNATVSLSWTQQESSLVSYNVSIVPQAAVIFVQGPESITIQLTVSYNTWYNVSIVGTLCGRKISSTTVELDYGKSTFLVIHLSLCLCGIQ